MIADDRLEPRPEVGCRVAAVDRGTQDRLRVRQRLALDRRPEPFGGDRRGIARPDREAADRAVAFGFGDPDDALHDGKCPLVAVEQVDHGEAVGRRRDRVLPPVLGSGRTVSDRLPDQLGGFGTGAEQTDDVTAHLPDVVPLDPAPQALGDAHAHVGRGGPIRG